MCGTLADRHVPKNGINQHVIISGPPFSMPCLVLLSLVVSASLPDADLQVFLDFSFLSVVGLGELPGL